MNSKLTALFFATKIECDLLLKKIEHPEKNIIHGFTFIKGKIGKLPLLICISGIGKINSTISAILAFEKFSIIRAIICGVAGAYPSSGLNVRDIAIAEKEIEADNGLLINCKDKNESFIFINSEDIPLYIPEAFNHLKKGTFLTVSACTGNLDRAKFLERKFKAICENMEGAAVAKVAQIYRIPAIEIRSISNIVTDRKKLISVNEVKKSAKVIQEFIFESLSIFTNSI